MELEQGGLGRKVLRVLFATVVVVVLCYYFVDCRVAFWAHDQNFRRFEVLRMIAEIPQTFFIAIPLIFIGVFVRHCLGRFVYADKVLLLVSVVVLTARSLKDQLKFFFGRIWPDTWINDNISLIRDKAYGFNFCSVKGETQSSFPSGHTTATVAAAALLALAFPRWRFVFWGISLAVVLAQVLNVFHFVGDCAGGACLGWVVARIGWEFTALKPHG